MPMDRRALLAGLACLTVVGTVRPSRAEAPAVFAVDHLAIRGADPVAYFTQGAAVAGEARFRLMWRGAQWLFASAANRDAFEMNPRAYAPRFGGYCAYAMSLGTLDTSDPEAWDIHDGALYLIHSLPHRSVWRGDIAGNLRRAEEHWPAILSE